MSDWETVGKTENKWEDVDGWETVSPSKSLVDQIPGLQPQGPAPVDPNLGDYVIGGVEAGMHGLSTLGAGAIGLAAGSVQDIADGNFSSKGPGPKAEQYTQAGTYEARTETGKDLSHLVDKGLNELMPLLGIAHTVPALEQRSMAKRQKEIYKKQWDENQKTVPEKPVVLEESALLGEHKSSVLADLEHLNAAEKVLQEKIKSTGTVDGEITAFLESIKEKRKGLEEELAVVEDALSGKSKDERTEEAIARDQRKNELVEGLRNRYGKAEELGPLTEADRAALDAELNKTTSAEEPPLMGEVRPVEEAPKVSPHEVMVDRIDQASRMDKNSLAQRIAETEAKIAELSKDSVDRVGLPGSDFNAKLDALKKELEAYKEFAKINEEPLPKVAKGKANPSDVASVYRANREITRLSKILDSINEKLRSYEEGKAPSGTMDVASLTKYRESLEKQIATAERIRQENLDRVNKKSGMPETKLAEDGTPAEYVPEKFSSIKDILDRDDGATVEHFLNNPELFNNVPGTKIHFSKSIPASMRTVMTGMLEKLGMNTDQLFFLTDMDKPGNLGYANTIGNTTIFNLDVKGIAEKATGKNSKGVSLLNHLKDVTKEKLEFFETIRVAAHEVGHAFLYKYVKEFANKEVKLTAIEKAWKDHIESTKLEGFSPMDMLNRKAAGERQTVFTEFFAEQVARTLMYQHFLGGKFHRVAKIHNELVTGMSNLVAQSMKLAKSKGIDVNKVNFVTDLVNDVITRNQESVKESGKTIFEVMEQRKNDDILFGKTKPDNILFRDKTYEEISESLDKRGWFGENHETNFNIAGVQINGLTTRAVQALGKGTSFLTRKMFSKNNLAAIYRDYPEVQYASRIIRSAEERGAKAFSKIWFGDTTMTNSWDSSNFFMKLSKVKEGDSPYMLVRNATNGDMHVVHELFKQGYEQGLPYTQTLSTLGNHLTPKQKLLFDSLGKMFKKMYDETVAAEQALGKRNTLPYKEGWYPSTRKGIYSVELSFNGRTFRREHFDTKVAAERFQRSLNRFNNIDIGSIVERDQVGTQTNQMMADAIKDLINRKFPTGAQHINAQIDAMLNRMATTGGNRSGHHQYRSNMMGYKGTELLKGTEDRGQSFRESIQALATEYPTSITRNYIKTFIEPKLATMTAEARPIVEQMRDSALGRNKDIMSAVSRPLDHASESALRFVSENILQKEYKNDASMAQAVHNHMVSWLYLLKVIPKVSFALLGQILTIPYVTRELSYGGHGMRAWYSMGKGMKQLAEATANSSKGAELRAAWKETSQNYFTFEPKFIEDLQLATGENRAIEFIKDWALMRKPAEAMDSLSRLATFSIAFTHYRDLGYSLQRAKYEARKVTDTTMNVYTSADSPAMFEHMGSIGRTVRPLQSFGNNVLGNFVSDVKHFKAKDINTWGPLVNYALSTVMIGGILSPVFMQEYEILRRLLNEKMGYDLPSLIDMLSEHDNVLDRVVPDNETAQMAIMYGIPSAVSGVDLASSTRANQTFLTLAGSVILGEQEWSRLMPGLGIVNEVLGGTAKLAKSKVTDISQGDLRKAADDAFPSGHLGYIGKEVLGANTTKIFGEKTDMISYGKEGLADKERNNTDIVAGMMGTRSTEDKWMNQKMASLTFDEKVRKQRVNSAASLYVETGDEKYIIKLAELGATGEEIESKIGSEAYKRVVDQETRFIADKSGNTNSNNAQRKATKLFKFGH